MSSGHGVPKPNKADHPGRDVHRERFTQGYTNLVSGVTHTLDEASGFQNVRQQPFVDSLGNPTPQHARSMERLDASPMAGYHNLPFGKYDKK
jgi:hypothetical protein